MLYTVPEDKFSVELPDGFPEPVRTMETVPSETGSSLDLIMHISAGDQGICTVCITCYNPEIELLDPRSIIDTGVEGIQEDLVCTIDSQQDLQFAHKYPAREVWYTENDQGTMFYTRMFFIYIKPRLIQVHFTSNHLENLSAVPVQRYFESLALQDA
jgi:hypothetical protein